MRKWPQWQQWVGYPHRISDDTFGYVSERLDPGQLRRSGIWIKHKLKRGKAFEANKTNGLLVVSLDANEQFCSDSRCCDDCLRACFKNGKQSNISNLLMLYSISACL